MGMREEELVNLVNNVPKILAKDRGKREDRPFGTWKMEDRSAWKMEETAKHSKTRGTISY